MNLNSESSCCFKWSRYPKLVGEKQKNCKWSCWQLATIFANTVLSFLLIFPAH